MTHFMLLRQIRIPALMLAEVVEDEIVTRELLPVNPAGPGLLKLNTAGDSPSNGDQRRQTPAWN